MKLDRRSFLQTSVGTGAFVLAGAGIGSGIGTTTQFVVRPPGAKQGSEFLRSCIRCFQCGLMCPNMAIKPMGLKNGLAAIFTPHINPREQACMLCMKCGEVCPTDALEKIHSDYDSIQSKVKMGQAEVDPSVCYSYNGRLCGVCYDACPFPEEALKLKLFAQPEVDTDKCVGCGLCERACIHIPEAIRIYPSENSVTNS